MIDLEMRMLEQQMIRDAIKNKRHDYAEDFLRPVYQYTSSEIVNTQRIRMMKSNEDDS